MRPPRYIYFHSCLLFLTLLFSLANLNTPSTIHDSETQATAKYNGKAKHNYPDFATVQTITYSISKVWQAPFHFSTLSLSNVSGLELFT